MKITKLDVKIGTYKNPKMKGKAYIEFDDCFAIENVRIIERNDGTLFAAMPSQKCSDGEYRDSCHPTNEEMRKTLDEAVATEYKRLKEEQTKEEEE